jgi:hypothetical protein
MRSKISLMAPRSPSSALAASLRAISCRMSALGPSPSSTLAPKLGVERLPHRPHLAAVGQDVIAAHVTSIGLRNQPTTVIAGLDPAIHHPSKDAWGVFCEECGCGCTAVA